MKHQGTCQGSFGGRIRTGNWLALGFRFRHPGLVRALRGHAAGSPSSRLRLGFASAESKAGQEAKQFGFSTSTLWSRQFLVSPSFSSGNFEDASWGLSRKVGHWAFVYEWHERFPQPCYKVQEMSLAFSVWHGKKGRGYEELVGSIPPSQKGAPNL